MKINSIKNSTRILIFALLLGFFQKSLAVGGSPDCSINFTGPAGNTLTSYMVVYPNYPNCNATFNTVVQNINAPLPLGTYLTWCIDANVELDPSQGYTVPGTTYTGLLFPSCDPNLNSELPPNHTLTSYVSPSAWQQVNYLLNHKSGTNFWNIQVAINDLVGGPASSGPGYPSFDPAVVQSMLTDASNNAAAWSPQCGSVVGGVYVIQKQGSVTLTNPVQLVIIEVPYSPITFTKCPSNLTLGCNPAASSIPDVQTPVNTNLVAAVSCAGYPLTITVTKSQAAVGASNYRYLSYNAADAYGNTATCMQTISWSSDTNAPVITKMAVGASLGCNPTTLPTDASIKPQVAATDNVGVSSIYVTHSDMTNGCTINRIFFANATDACGNTSPWSTAVYSWTIDTTAPTITSIPAGGSLGYSPTNLPTDASVKALITAFDTCTLTNISVVHSDMTNGCIFYRTFFATAADECGNTSPASTTVYSWTNGVPSAYVCMTGPTNVTCSTKGIYTCYVTNNGTCSFASCIVSACGQSFTCPALKPGQGCSIPVSYTYQVSDCGLFNCKAIASCITSNSCTPVYNCQGSCQTKVCGVPSCKVIVCGPTNGICQSLGNYTCFITNNGTACFSSCQITACGQTFSCPTLKPGEGCSIPVNYTWQIGDCGAFNCQAIADCVCTNSTTPTCTAQATCGTSVVGVPKCNVTVSGPSVCSWFLPATYTCTVVNSGTAPISACKLTACGKTFTCPALNPGQSCAVTCTQSFSLANLFSGFNCQAVASCTCTQSTSSSCSGQGSWFTSLH